MNGGSGAGGACVGRYVLLETRGPGRDICTNDCLYDDVKPDVCLRLGILTRNVNDYMI